MGYILIITGIALLIAGIVLVFRKTTKNQTERPTLSTPTKDKRFEENKAKGDAFEGFIVQQFNKQYFTLQEWRGDKYVAGNYPVSSHFPDLEIIFKHKGQEDHFAIECKWRKDYYQGSIAWAHGYQVKNYQNYAKETGLPVFVVIGVGGSPQQPTDLYLIPLQEIKYQTLYKKTLAAFRKDVTTDFFWDGDKKQLK